MPVLENKSCPAMFGSHTGIVVCGYILIGVFIAVIPKISFGTGFVYWHTQSQCRVSLECKLLYLVFLYSIVATVLPVKSCLHAQLHQKDL